MKVFGIFLLSAMVMTSAAFAAPVPADDPVGQKVEAYFDQMFATMKSVADQNPTPATFRKIAQPVFNKVSGLFGGSLLDNSWTIRQSLFAIHAAARGFSLKKVAELDYFRDQMEKSPSPQLSEPGHGSIMQPRLIAMRYPVLKDGKVESIVSMMILTEHFLQDTGLQKAKAFRITCLGKVAETRGKLSDSPRVVELDLPSTHWKIEYDK